MVSYIGVIVATVVSFIVGFLWYGPLFGKLWMKLQNFSKADINNAKKKGMTGLLVINFVATLITAFVLSYLIDLTASSTVSSALSLGFLIWLGFFATTSPLGSVLWEGKPFNLYVLNAAYWLVIVLVMSGILAVL
jgi:hypothetical protein